MAHDQHLNTLVKNETVVLVPGMFSPRAALLPMAQRIKRHGYQTRLFQNRFLQRSPLQNAQALLTQLQSLNSDTIHLLGHSLGGIVIMQALHLNARLPADQRIGNGCVVLIASPVRGSDLARRLSKRRECRWFLGRCMEEDVQGGLLSGVLSSVSSGELNGQCAGVNSAVQHGTAATRAVQPMDSAALPDGRQYGVISGSARRGLTALFYRPQEANDGLVRVSETQLTGAQDTICIPQSHAIMLFSRTCAELAVQFFQHGQFVTTR